MNIEWNECEVTGIPRIDADHRMVLALVNELTVAIRVNSPAEVMNATFDTLIRRVDEHFREEEAEFAALPQARADGHTAEHLAVAALTRDLKAAWQGGGAATLDDLALKRFARAWLRHIHTADLELAAALK